MHTLLIVHASLGLLLLGLGGVALAGRKSRRARHPLVGTAYFWLLTSVLASAMLLGQRHAGWSLFEIMTPPTFALGLTGYLMARLRPTGWLRWHISGMAGSYIGVVTAFGFQLVPRAWFVYWWILPTVVGTALIVRAQRRVATARAA